MSGNTPHTRPEIVEVSREELLRKRAVLLDRIDHDVRAELEGIDFLLADDAASAAPETSPAVVWWCSHCEKDVPPQDVLHQQERHRACGSYVEQVAAVPVAADPAGETRTEWGVLHANAAAHLEPVSYGQNEAAARFSIGAGYQLFKRTVPEPGPWTPAAPTTDTTRKG